jgi:hypothetical protein
MRLAENCLVHRTAAQMDRADRIAIDSAVGADQLKASQKGESKRSAWRTGFTRLLCRRAPMGRRKRGHSRLQPRDIRGMQSEMSIPGTGQITAWPWYWPGLRLRSAGPTIAVAMSLYTLAAAHDPESSAPPTVAAVSLGTPVINTEAATKLALASVSKNSDRPSSAGVSLKFFFGSVEFDWDRDTPGGVPGFGPVPNSVSQNAITEASR